VNPAVAALAPYPAAVAPYAAVATEPRVNPRRVQSAASSTHAAPFGRVQSAASSAHAAPFRPSPERSELNTCRCGATDTGGSQPEVWRHRRGWLTARGVAPPTGWLTARGVAPATRVAHSLRCGATDGHEWRGAQPEVVAHSPRRGVTKVWRHGSHGH